VKPVASFQKSSYARRVRSMQAPSYCEPRFPVTCNHNADLFHVLHTNLFRGYAVPYTLKRRTKNAGTKTPDNFLVICI
jgi:hypothetical protein